MANTKEYRIKINGLTESIDAVKSLEKQLSSLDERMKALESRKVNLAASTSTVGSASSGGRSSALSEEEKLEKQIAAIDEKREAYSKEIYQNYLAAKDVLNETVKDQKQLAAAERLQANTYANTMKGIKQKLADLKTVHFTTDLSSGEFKKQAEEMNALTEKLKKLEQEYGVFSRSVGDYKTAADGFNKIRVAIGDTVREYGNYRQAIKELRQERFQLSQTLGQETEEYKKIDVALKQLESDYNDLNKSSKFMDELLDTMQSFTALASVGQGLSALFGIDDTEIQRSIQKLVALQNVLKGIETIQLQIQKREGLGKWLDTSSKGIDKFVAKITGAEQSVDGLTMATRRGTIAVRGLSMALKGIAGIIALIGFAVLSAAIEKFAKDSDTAKVKADALTLSLNALNKAYENRLDMLATGLIKGEVSDNQYLANLYKEQSGYLKQSVGYINDMASAMNKMTFTDYFSPSKLLSLNTTGYTGSRLSGETNKTAGDILNWDYISADYSKAFKDLEKAEEEFNKCSEAVNKNMNYFEAYGKGLGDWANSLLYTMGDTRDVMMGIGNAIAGEYNSRLVDAMTKLSDAQNNVQKGVKGAENEVNKAIDDIRALYKQMNSSEAYQSFLANMDKYIPDDAVREKLQSIIGMFNNFAQSADESTKEWASFWARKRIEKMAEGRDKALALLELERRETIAKYGDTQEHINDLNEVYARKRIETEKQYAKEYNNALADLESTKIQAMKESWEKQQKQLDLERKERIRKIVDENILVEKRIAAVNALYDKKILDAKKKWAEDVLNIYRNLRDKIEDFNEQTYNTEVNTAMQNVENRKNAKIQEAGYSTINGHNFDDTKTLEQYYKKVLDIEEEANKRLVEIQKEKLANDLEFNKKEEELRHERVVNNENGELKKQYEAGKIDKQQYDQLIEDENAAHYARMKALDEEYAANLKKTTQDSLQQTKDLYNKYYNDIVTDIQKERQKIDEIASQKPVTDNSGWGVVNTKKTSENYNNSLKQYEDLKQKIIKKQEELDQSLKDHKIDAKDFAIKQDDLKKEMKAIDEAVKNVQQRQKELVKDFLQSIQQYIQAGMDSFNTIMNQLWDIQDIQFDKEQEQLDKENEMLADKLKEQEDLVNKHKSTIDAIEDELATARGDRRQHLIDQLNAEMAAQREAAKQQKKIEQEQAKQQQKQDDLEKKRKKAQYERDLLQAIVNGAMAVTYAAMNSWPIPAIPMMALAASTTAAQIAIMASNKPYAKGGQLDGGVAQGKRHRDGGIPVLGGRASIEGGEFITNRQTTASNVDLLNYINNKHRKLDLDDFVDFYSSGKMRKNLISMSPRTKFEQGGVIPTLSTDIDINDRLIESFEKYAEKPTVVQVVDILNKSNDVKRVQVLAGLENN